MANKVKVSTPEILWHGGGNENGKPDPVYSVDFHPLGVLATSGIDANVPPKGSVRFWRINSLTDDKEYIFEFNDHPSSINAVKFSPCGKLLATASDRSIIIYTVADKTTWEKIEDMKNVERTWISPNLDEIYDIQWSPDSSYIIAGSINAKAEIIKISNRDAALLTGHSSYVQGVAWDPLNQIVVTVSADRSCKFHALKTTKANNTVKIASKGHSVLRTTTEQPRNLFADSTVPCFFRRPCFSPDGALIFIPTGLYRSSRKVGENAVNSTSANQQQSFCSYILSRNHLTSPLLCLAGLDEPSVAVRCSPVLYKLMHHGNGSEPMINGKYRFVFAIVTISTIFIYDTQHPHPLMKIAGCHLATINDASWSPDGNLLVVCSSDGYVTFVRFPPGSLGEPLSKEEVPDSVKRSLPCHYGVDLTAIESAAVNDDLGNISPTQPNSNVDAMEIDESDDQDVLQSNSSQDDGRAHGLFSQNEMNLMTEEDAAPSIKSNVDLLTHELSPSNISDSSILGFHLLASQESKEDFSPSKKLKIMAKENESTSTLMINNSPTRKDLYISPSTTYSPLCESKNDLKSEIVAKQQIAQIAQTLPSTPIETQPKKEKKRIAPTLISPLISCSFSGSSSSSSSDINKMQ